MGLENIQCTKNHWQIHIKFPRRSHFRVNFEMVLHYLLFYSFFCIQVTRIKWRPFDTQEILRTLNFDINVTASLNILYLFDYLERFIKSNIILKRILKIWAPSFRFLLVWTITRIKICWNSSAYVLPQRVHYFFPVLAHQNILIFVVYLVSKLSSLFLLFITQLSCI